MEIKKKVVWFTYFSNEVLRKGIQPHKKVISFAPWIPAAIKVFYGDPKFEIHVVTPHYYIGCYKSFVDDNIYYHSFCKGIPIFGYGWPSWFPFDRWTNYLNLQLQGIRILRKINPDIIHFWGAENTFASIYNGLNDSERKKCIVSVQGFVLGTEGNHEYPLRYKLQNLILAKNQYFFTTCKWMDEKILKLNVSPKFYPLIYPINLPKYDNTIKKKYDLLFYARVNKSKGIEDLLEAISLIKKQNLELSLLIIGPCNKEYESDLKIKAEKLGISEQLTWAGYMETQEALYQKAQEANIYVLPTHSEILASTVRESMAMKLPVITYATGCLPMLNSQSENVILVTINDITQLANSITNLYNDFKVQESLKERAYNYIIDFNSEQNFKKQLELGYKDILTN